MINYFSISGDSKQKKSPNKSGSLTITALGWRGPPLCAANNPKLCQFLTSPIIKWDGVIGRRSVVGILSHQLMEELYLFYGHQEKRIEWKSVWGCDGTFIYIYAKASENRTRWKKGVSAIIRRISGGKLSPFFLFPFFPFFREFSALIN